MARVAPVRPAAIHVIVVMGVAGAGKTTAGQALAEALGWTFHDADAFHPPANIDKMSHGHPLTDDDRAPWLEALHALVTDACHQGKHVILACSALKQSYRDRLVPEDAHSSAVQFVQLNVPIAELRRRLATRVHYFKPELLASQLASLETPRDALIVDGALPVDEIVRRIRAAFGL